MVDQDRSAVRTFLITTYTPSFNGLTSQVRKSWELLGCSSSTQSLHEQGLTIGFRRPKNLRDMLVKAGLPTLNVPKRSDAPLIVAKLCKSKNCRYCRLLDKSGMVKSHSTGQQYRSRHNVIYNSNNLIYCITCKRCGKQCVGQTKRNS